MKPLVSILIPAYNAEEWIAETINSAICQTWQRKETIVVDDGSTDDTAEVARRPRATMLTSSVRETISNGWMRMTSLHLTRLSAGSRECEQLTVGGLFSSVRWAFSTTEPSVRDLCPPPCDPSLAGRSGPFCRDR